MQKDIPTSVIEQLTIKYYLRFEEAYELAKESKIFDFEKSDPIYHRVCEEYVKGMIDREKYETENPNFEKIFTSYLSKLPDNIKELLTKK